MKKWLGIAILCIVLGVTLVFIQQRFTAMDSMTNWHVPLSGKVIILDPGHGGVDGGSSSKDGVLEKEVALEVALMLREYLQEAGALVFMTREGDYDLAREDLKGYSNRKREDLNKRAEIVNESGGDMFVSIHLNAVPSSRWNGAQTFYHPRVPDNHMLAYFIQDEMMNNLENSSRTIKSIEELFILRRAHIPGVLVEAGFLSNPSDASYLKTEEYQNKVAVSIYRGILRYYSGEEIEES
ncbi:N-acetylmuramoyl-L-alanine amidase [Alteribacillus persepolensis]|uniref:N-acetylmuramoyl-L-alanine amidase n=1 Tax=Alteribacillus persepolensis TaxID=568899 RepID=A0A1G8HMJ4_9BACI|nr:N-acetylmuramoyl-L-alanine amidase CwlD [Alteribacillus persepolensis]SDI07812.1 N-acetylmuramoyl-L-alanine amidase [Alteribacillus persepolensis]